jgi:hypothetical protein
MDINANERNSAIGSFFFLLEKPTNWSILGFIFRPMWQREHFTLSQWFYYSVPDRSSKRTGNEQNQITLQNGSSSEEGVRSSSSALVARFPLLLSWRSMPDSPIHE